MGHQQRSQERFDLFVLGIKTCFFRNNLKNISYILFWKEIVKVFCLMIL